MKSKRQFLKSLSKALNIALVAMSFFMVYSTAAHAFVFGLNDRTFYVGVAKTSDYAATDQSTIIEAPASGGVPAGITIYGLGTSTVYLSGTALPGTVGAPSTTLRLQDEDNLSVSKNIDVLKGPQTVAVDYGGSVDVSDIYVPVGSASFALDAYSLNGDGDKLGPAPLDLDANSFHWKRHFCNAWWTYRYACRSR
jgi:hypothetical protein